MSYHCFVFRLILYTAVSVPFLLYSDSLCLVYCLYTSHDSHVFPQRTPCSLSCLLPTNNISLCHVLPYKHSTSLSYVVPTSVVSLMPFPATIVPLSYLHHPDIRFLCLVFPTKYSITSYHCSVSSYKKKSLCLVFPCTHIASVAQRLRRPPRERKIQGSNPACVGIFFEVESYR